MFKILLLAIAIFSNAVAVDSSYSGTAHYVKNSFFGKVEKSWTMTIDFSNEKVVLSLPEYGCKTELILLEQNENVYIYSEKHITGSCKIDSSASTQIRVRDSQIDYLWQSDNETLSSLLNKVK